MKHAIKLSTVILASIFAVVACEKEKAPEAEYQPGETITITATLPSVPATDPATKVDFTQGTNKVDLAWSTGDALTIIGEDTSESQTFTLSGISGSKANFTGTAVSGSSFTVLYPGTVTSVAAMDAKSFTGQTQTGNESLAHLTGAWTAKVTGLSDFSDVKFAAPAGGTFAQSGILKFHIQVPDVVTTVKGVGIEAPSAVFYTDNASTKATSLDMTLSGVTLDAKHAFTAYMAISQKNSEAVAAGETVKVKFTDSYSNVWEKEITLTTSFALQAGKVNVITLDKSAWTSTGRYAGGTGVDGDPWLITEPIHMQHMVEDLASGETKYFKLMDDIDMVGESWTPANDADPYDKAVSLDGNGKTISNLNNALFCDLNGSVKDLTISSSTVGGSKNIGVLARLITVGGSVDNVDITNCTVSTSSYEGAGGLVGIITAAADIEDVSVSNCTISTKTSYPGGVAGLVQLSGDVVVNISRCCLIGGTVTATSYYAGGILGANNSTTGTINISNCYATGDVSSNRWAGGILGGHINTGITNITNTYATGSVSTTKWGAGGVFGQATKAGVSLVRCMAFNSAINGGSGTTYSSGAVVAHAKSVNIEVNYCFRSNSISYACVSVDDTALFDMAFVSPAGTLPQCGSNTNAYCHHGKETTKTLSELVQDATTVGTAWSGSIWDFSGNEPKLK